MSDKSKQKPGWSEAYSAFSLAYIKTAAAVKGRLQRFTRPKLMPGKLIREINSSDDYYIAWQVDYNHAINRLPHHTRVTKDDVLRVIWEEGLLAYYSPLKPVMLRAAHLLLGDGYYTREDAKLYTRILYACRWYRRAYDSKVQLTRSFGIAIEFFIDRYGRDGKLRELFNVPSDKHVGVLISEEILFLAKAKLHELFADTHEFSFGNNELPRMLEVGDEAEIFVNTKRGRELVPVVIVDFFADGRVKVRGISSTAQEDLEYGKKLHGVLPTDFSKHRDGYVWPDYSQFHAVQCPVTADNFLDELKEKYGA